MPYIPYEHNCLTEYDEAKYTDLVRAEGEAIGMTKGEAIGESKGITKGTIKTLVSLLKKGLISENSAAEDVGMSIDDFRKAVATYCD